MTRRPAVDQGVRDRAIRDTGASIALSAGAGSGKTAVLVDRVLALLEAGVPPARIAAITFTEKAAGELQERVRDRLERAVLERPDHPALARALAEVSDLVLSTIHSFCQRLLVAEALEAGWAPDTRVGDALFDIPGVSHALRDWLRGLPSRHGAPGRLARRLSRRALRRAVQDLCDHRDLEPVVHPEPFDAERLHRAIVGVADALDEALTACTDPERCKLVQGNRPLIDHLRHLRGLAPPDAVAAAWSAGVKGSLAGGRKADWVGDGKERFKDEVRAWRALLDEIPTHVHGLLTADLRAHLLPAVERVKAEHGRAEFQDLLFRAAALLAHAPVRRRLAARFDAILIDEVQDTDPIQAEVAALLSRPPDVDGPWDAVPPRPGHLFAVGDPKQSIYRFRRADVASWHRLRELVSRSGAHLELRQNFRSVPGIVHWVNAVFADLPGYVPQVPYRAEAELDPVVLVPVEELADEVEAVVRHLVALRDGGARVADRDTGALRPMRWSDVMVLLPSWYRAEAVHDALTDAGIPALVEGGTGFLDRGAVQLALSAMQALDEPADGRAVVHVLRGLFGLTHDDLLRHVRAGGTWRYTVPDPPPGPVADAFEVLRPLHRARGRTGWVALLDALLARAPAGVAWSLLRDGDARLANLDKLRALVRQLEPECGSPGEVIRRLRALARAERDLSRADLDAAAVRITSYFKAKGLEAPVVALCVGKRAYSSGAAVVDRARGRVAIPIGSAFPPPAWSTWTEQDRAEALAEQRRWMYVAATRARDQLFIAASPESNLTWDVLLDGHPDPFEAEDGARLPVSDAAYTVVRHLDALPPPPAHRPTFPGRDDAVDALLADPPAAGSGAVAAWQAARRARIRAAREASVRWRSVHEVATRERVVGPTDGGVGAAGGTLVHRVLEHVDLGEPHDACLERARALLPRLRPPGMDDATFEACGAVVARILSHEVVAQARRAPERWQEVPFTFADGGQQVSGTIDLCFPTDPSRAEWVVVDWKSDLPPPGTPAHRNYQRQLALYARALLATVAPCERVQTHLVGPYPELAPDPVDDAVARAPGPLKAVVRRLVAAGAPVPRVGMTCAEPPVRAELAWPDARVALVVDADPADVARLQAAGWVAVAADSADPTWAEDAEARLRAVGVSGRPGHR